MSNNLETTATEITKYLDNFKDTNGKSPCQLKVSLMVENYCKLYIKKTTPTLIKQLQND